MKRDTESALPPEVKEGIRIKSGAMKTIVFDNSSFIRRRYNWSGEILFEPGKDDFFINSFDDPVELNPFGGIPPTPSADEVLLGRGAIEVTRRGPIQPGNDDRPIMRPVSDTKPVETDHWSNFWSHLPPPFPLPFGQPDIDITPDHHPPIELPDIFSTYDPCDLFHPLGPFGPFVEPPDDITLMFPRAPWLGPYQAPLEEAVQEAFQEFLEEMGEAGNRGTIHSEDWENAGRKAGTKAGKVLWKFIRDRFEVINFGGDLNFDSFCEFSSRRPWVTGIGIFVGLAGYGLHLGNQYRRNGKIKLDLGDIEFEWDSETGEWGLGLKVKFRF